MRVGVDFGTTNSGIAIYDGDAMHLLKVDDSLPTLLPSII
jgi:molecular chaperone DnaK (HSP70)